MTRSDDNGSGGDDARESLVAEAVDDFRERCAKGERPDAEEYAGRFPQIADELRRLLPALSALDLSSDAATPTAIGDFRIRREVGRGGMAIVYEAEQLSLGRRVALKVLPFAAVMDPRQLQRFKNEAQAAAHLHHGHIVPVHSIGCERGVHYYAMQFIEGMSVAQMIEELRSIARRDMPKESSSAAVRAITGGSGARTEAYCKAVARLGIQAAEALDHAHQQGVVHRDIKPANLLVDASGHLWITDFGLASFTSQPGLTMTGDIVGTVRYMSPEQALAKRVPIDHRTDIYSLGVTLYELLTLETAFPGDDPHKVIQEIAFRDPPPARSLNPAVPAELETILIKAMAKYPAERFATAQEMADDLARYMRNEPIQARRPTLVQRAGKWARRHAALVWGVAAGLLLAVTGLVTGATLLWREQSSTEQQRDRAEANLALALEALDHVYLDEVEITPKLRPGLSLDLLEKGLGFYERFAEENANHANVRCETGRALVRAGMIYRELGRTAEADRALDSAIACLRDVVRNRPDWAQAHGALGIALLRAGQIDAAIVELGEATRLARADVSPLLSLGSALAEAGRYDEAIASWRELIRHEPDNVFARANISDVLRRKGHLDEAIAECREVIRLIPAGPGAHTGLGTLLASKGLLDEAITEFREAIRLNPAAVRARSRLGVALSCKGLHDDAIKVCREATRLEPDSADAQAHLGIALSAKGLRDDAISAYREAIRLGWRCGKMVRLAPGTGFNVNTVQVARYCEREYEEALEALERSMSLRNGGEPHDWLCVAMAKWRRGERDEALALYEKSLAWMKEHAPDDPELKRFAAEAADLMETKKD